MHSFTFQQFKLLQICARFQESHRIQLAHLQWLTTCGDGWGGSSGCYEVHNLLYKDFLCL